MKYDILIADGNSLAHRAGAVLQLTNNRGEPTSVVFGVLSMIRSILGRFEFSEILICWDLKGSILKKSIYPEYKEHRKKSMPQEYYVNVIKQIEDLVVILPAFGIKQLRRVGVEADDIIGILCENIRQKILVLSSDQDLFQVISLGADVYYPPKDIILTGDNFEETYGVRPKDWIFYRTVIGDASDNIKGLPGFGEVTGKKLISKFGPWPNWFGAENKVKLEVLCEVNKTQKTVLQSDDVLEVLTRNYSLMTLGFLDTDSSVEIMAEYDQKPVFDEMKIRGYFLEKQFDSFLNRFHGWVHPFRTVYLRKKEKKNAD